MFIWAIVTEETNGIRIQVRENNRREKGIQRPSTAVPSGFDSNPADHGKGNSFRDTACDALGRSF